MLKVRKWSPYFDSQHWVSCCGMYHSNIVVDTRVLLQCLPIPTKSLLLWSHLPGKVLRARANVQVYIKADASLPYGDVVRVMTVLQQAGAGSVGLITDPPDIQG